MVTTDIANFLLNGDKLNESIVNDSNNNLSSVNMNTLASGISTSDISGEAINYKIELCEDIIKSSRLFDDNNYLKANHRFDTVSLSALDNRKTLKDGMFKMYTTKLFNKFTTSRNRNMERLVNKNGEANINRINIESRRKKYISDLFNTIVDMKWHYILIVSLMSFVVSWTIFGTIWFMISKWSVADKPCISNMYSNSSFFESFLFSVETQQTIGYGYRFITHDCSLSIIVLMLQCAFSVFLESFLGGVIFAKLSRPKKRTETLIFSKQVCNMNNEFKKNF